MSGEEFLNSIRNLDYEVAALDLERTRNASHRRDILDKAESITAGLSGICVQHEVSSKTESLGMELASEPDVKAAVQKMEQYQRRIARKYAELVARKQQARDYIDQVRDAKLRALLTHRFLNNLRWTTIADLMGYNEMYVRTEMKAQALAAFDEVFKKPIKTYLSFDEPPVYPTIAKS